MITIKANKIIGFDVDDVLITQDYQANKSIQVSCFNEIQLVCVNEEMVSQVKKSYEQNNYIIVWSQQGYEWAEAVVKAIGLENHVNLVMTKVSECYDDLPINEWMKLNKIEFPKK